MKIYNGYCDASGDCHVYVRQDQSRERLLRLRLDLWNHSPTGFQWGYGGSGPAQLALALLADALGDDERALRLAMDFKWRYVAPLPQGKPWTMTSTEIMARVIALEAEAAARIR